MDLSSARDEFPIVNNRIFFDHAKVAPVPYRLRQTVKAFVENACEYGTVDYSNWIKDIENVRESFARLINADVSEVAFIKNTSEGISIVANGIDWKPGDNVVVPDIEFPANVYPWWNLRSMGVETRIVKNKEGRILFDDIVEKTDSRTRVISVSSVECNSGFRNDLGRIGAFCRDRGIFFCVDAIQSLGALTMDVKEYCIDFLAADGHKWLCSVEGCGGFYVSKRVLDKLKVTVIGWNSVVNATDFMNYNLTFRPDARRFEEGSLNIIGIKALGASLSLFHELGMAFVEARILQLGDYILERLYIRKVKILNSTQSGERSGILSFTGDFDLDDCTTFMRNHGVSLTMRDGLIRISPHFYNSEGEADQFFELLDNFLK